MNRRRLSLSIAATVSAGVRFGTEPVAAGLVDELHLFVVPVVVGRGKRALPEGVRLDLELVGEQRFASGVVHLRYRTAS